MVGKSDDEVVDDNVVLGDGGGARRLCTTNDDSFIGTRVIIGREAGCGFMSHAGGVDQVNPRPGLTYSNCTAHAPFQFFLSPRLSLFYRIRVFAVLFSSYISSKLYTDFNCNNIL